LFKRAGKIKIVGSDSVPTVGKRFFGIFRVPPTNRFLWREKKIRGGFFQDLSINGSDNPDGKPGGIEIGKPLE
jgi:hypothetical protein